MRNESNTKIRAIFSAVRGLPYFSLNDLASMETDKNYLKTLFSRYEKDGKVIRLKKGVYVAKEYVDKKGGSSYLEFLSNILYEPSYLSLEYVLCKHNILTDVPIGFTSVAKNKTAVFSNDLGKFIYRKIKDDLFAGFEINKEGDLTICAATKAKAFFDYLYLRKNDIINRKSADELRLNVKEMSKKDKAELNRYVKIEGSKKMNEILGYLF